VNRLWVKLTAAFLAVALAAIGVVALLTVRTTDNQFRQYIVASGMGAPDAIAASLEDFYARNGSWTGVESLLASTGPGSMGMGGMGRGGRTTSGMAGPSLAVADTQGRVVASRSGEMVGELLPADILGQGIALIQDGRRIGTLLNIRPTEVVLDAQAEAFLRQVQSSLLWAALGALALSLILGVLLSRLLTAPLVRLTHAAQAVAAGDLSQRVDIRSRDETGELGSAFNEMAASLAEAETMRKNLIADVSHELRTPLSVVQGNLQALLDGVYPLEMAQVASLYDETRLLTRLVDDLHDLALADAGRLRLERAPVDVNGLARAAAAQFAPVAESSGVPLELEEDVDALGETLFVLGDADRLAQVLRNLLSNALRHTPAGGRVSVAVTRVGEQVRVQVADTGSGISPEDLPYVFDRFYRGDRSRSRQGGGAGLGLAIARQIVAAHGGTLTVSSEPGEGATFTMVLPVERLS